MNGTGNQQKIVKAVCRSDCEQKYYYSSTKALGQTPKVVLGILSPEREIIKTALLLGDYKKSSAKYWYEDPI